MRILSTHFVALAACASVLSAQAPGHRLFAPFGAGSATTYLLDNAGELVHSWPGSPSNRVTGMQLEPDGTLLRSSSRVGMPGTPTGRGGIVQRVAFDGTIDWQFFLDPATQWMHHDVERLPNGNVIMIAWDILTRADAVAAGRDPALQPSATWLPDSIVEVRQTGPTTGDIVWEWHFMDHVIQDHDPTKANFGVVVDHPELLDINFPRGGQPSGEWNHSNAISYDASRDVILVSSPLQREIYLIDHSTTTAEAAGHTGGNYGKGGDFLYRWGDPRAYGVGTSADQKLFYHHGSHFIPPGRPGEGNILIFNNQAGAPLGQNYSSVLEIVLPPTFDLLPGQAWGPTQPVWEYTDPVPATMWSQGMSNAVRLPNGNTLVDSGLQGWLFELDTNEQIVWEYRATLPLARGMVSVFQVEYYERYLWADREVTQASAPTNVRFDLVAGTAQANKVYVMLGSASGTSPGLPVRGVTLPLVPDPYLIFTANASAAGVPPFLGTLDGAGNASATLFLPPLPVLAGLTLHHAYAVFDTATRQVTHVSNPVPLRYEP
ncbi:MAG: aryl-sulfate sulfotransferase [Planctomycetota bacterium]